MPSLFKRINSQFQPITNVTFTYTLTGGGVFPVIFDMPARSEFLRFSGHNQPVEKDTDIYPYTGISKTATTRHFG